jgi:ribosomal protein S18 acetylase RimI-like enzyme
MGDMEEIIIRKAEISDLETLLEFEQGIATAERPMDSTLKEGEIHYYDLGQLVTADDVCVLVAEKNGELIGSGYARILKAKDYLKHDKYAHLGFMYVKQDYRGQGINRQIIQGLTKWCREKNIMEMRLEVYDSNLAAINAYKRAGFTKNLVEMRIDLNDQPNLPKP